jgi:ATP-dependent Clp protease ATP-binding subunit ClpA
MFERFTDKARRVVVLAQEEARMLNHNYIGTEHILLGLIHEGEGVAAQVLVRLGADLNRVRREVIRLAQDATGGDRPTRIATGESVRLRGPGEHWIAELLSTLARLTERIEAIEHHLGIAGAAGPEASAREPEATGKPEQVGEPEPAGEPKSAGEPEPAGEAKPAEDSPAASDLPDGPALP